MSHPIYLKMNTVFVHVSDLTRSVRWYSQLLDRSFKEEDVSDPVYTFSYHNTQA
ncbi:VOC family protein [Halobacillus sp. B23F22_1]|uniref:VOC family protein n=1 Tax=Halobacillus sp. B23F22_1 TaxID=3459514 RepID=UPI00373E1AAA